MTSKTNLGPDRHAPPRLHILFALAWVVWTVAVLSINSTPGSQLPRFDTKWYHFPGFDKVVHFGMYSGMAALLWRSVMPRVRGGFAAVRAPIVFCFVMTAAIGGFDELNQLRVPGRSGDPWDFLADCVGAAFAVALGAFLWRGRWRS